MTGFPVILSAPSGAGKTTLLRRLLDVRNDVGYSVSCTTRQPRAKEQEGRDYYFVSRQEFLDRRARGEFAESADVHGHLYGTLQSEVQRVLRSGKHVLMDIDVQGAAQFRRAFPDSVMVFVLPPSGEVLLERLQHRHTENGSELAARLHSALLELQAIETYQYVVVNDDLDAAVRSTSSIIDAESTRRERILDLEQRIAQQTEQLEQALKTHHQ